MESDWESIDWLANAGDLAIRKRAQGVSLSAVEQLVYEIWLLDIQACNGGLSQYFGNCGLAQWKQCLAAVSPAGLRSFASFSEEVERVIAGARDPYKAIIKAGRAADDLYLNYQSAIARDLRDFAGSRI